MKKTRRPNKIAAEAIGLLFKLGSYWLVILS
jgi:hypothetical protein